MSVYAETQLGNVGELTLAQQNAVLAHIAKQPGVRVICAVEAHKDVHLKGWQRHGTVGELIFVHPRTRIINKGSFLCSLSRQGYRIRLRRFPWVIVHDVHARRAVQPFAVHMPPRWAPLLKPIYARRLRRFLRGSVPPYIAGGDWNAYLHNDPCGLHWLLGATWHGQRIDGWAVDNRLNGHHVGHWVEMVPAGRDDKHQTTYVTLGGRR